MHDNNRKKSKKVKKTKKVVKSSKKKLIASEDDIFYMQKIKILRSKKSTDKERDNAYSDILAKLKVKIKKIAAKFQIPGHSYEDCYQECCIALQTKAIADYDKAKGSDPDKIASFEKFALFCIKRHLITVLKCAKQIKHEAMNSSKSIDADNSQSNDDLSLANILSSKDKEVVEQIIDNDNFKILINKLLSKLSDKEKKIFFLYAKQNSYEEIAIIMANSFGIKVTEKNKEDLIKSVDNALMRIKVKAREIIEKFNQDFK